MKIAGPLYFVGTKGLSSFLFVTAEGNIFFNTGMPSSGPMIEESIRKLGFKVEDIKVIINGHAHSDHAGAIASLKAKLGAQLAVMREDVPAMEGGGKGRFPLWLGLEGHGFPAGQGASHPARRRHHPHGRCPADCASYAGPYARLDDIFTKC